MSEDIRKMIDKVKNFKQFVNEQQINEIWTRGGYPTYLDDNFIVKDNLMIIRKKQDTSKIHNKTYNDAELANELTDKLGYSYEQSLSYVETWKDFKFNEIMKKRF